MRRFIRGGIVLATTIALLSAPGCGKGKPPEAPASPPAAGGDSEKAEAPAEPEIRIDAVRQVEGVSLGSSEKLRRIVETATVRRLAPDAAPAPAKAACETARRRGMLLGDTVFEIGCERPEGSDAWLGGPLVLVLPLTAEQRAKARPGNAGAVYLSELGPFWIRGAFDPEAGTVTFTVMHLSLYTTAVQAAEGEVAALILRQAEAAADTAEGMATDALKEAIDDTLDRILPESVKSSMKMKLLAKIWERREELAELAKSAGAENPADIAQSSAKLIGKIVVDNLDDGAFASVMGDLADNVELAGAAGEALVKARQGDYWAAVEVFGRAAGEKTPLYKAVTGAAEQVQRGIDAWREHEWEAAFAAWTKGAPAGFLGLRKPVDDHDWEQLARSYGGIVETVRVRFGIHDPEKASAYARKMFEDRERREAARKAEEGRLLRLWEVFQGGKHWPHRKAYLEQTGLAEAPSAVQFDAFLRTVRSVEHELGLLGIQGGALVWTDVRAGKFGMQEHARALLSAFATGGADAYHAKLAEIRKALARDRALPAAKKPAPAPKAADPKAPKGPLIYDVQLAGDWKDRFELVKKVSPLGEAWVAVVQRAVPVGEGSIPTNVVWNGKVEKITATKRRMAGDIGGTITIREGDGQWDMGEALSIAGSFEGDLLPGPTFEGTWKVKVGEKTFRGTWKGVLRK